MMAVERSGHVSHQLCLVPDKADPMAMPIVIEELQPTEHAVFRVGQEEACTVSRDEAGDLIISALEPSMIFLTPNLAQFPGMRTRHVKLINLGEGFYRTFYSKDKENWTEWQPNIDRAAEFKKEERAKEKEKEERSVTRL